MTPIHYFHLGSSGSYTSYLICLQEAIHIISHFLCFMAPFHYFHLGSSGGYSSYLICIQKAIHFISHFQCFMAPFHYFHLGSSGGFTLFLPFSVLHGTISNALILSLLEAIIFMALFHCMNIGSSKTITFFAILNASWQNSTAFIGVFGGYTPYLPFQRSLAKILCCHLGSFRGYTPYLPF